MTDRFRPPRAALFLVALAFAPAWASGTDIGAAPAATAPTATPAATPTSDATVPAAPAADAPSAETRSGRLGPVRGDAEREAAATVLASIDKLLAFAAGTEAQNQLQTAAFLDRELAPYFDFAYMAEFVAGPAWARLDDPRREALAAQLESNLLSGLSARVWNPPGRSLRFLRPGVGRNGSVDVRVTLSGGNGRGRPEHLVFRMFESQDGWKVYDLLIRGRSLLERYRNAFAQRALGGAAGL